MSAKLLWRHCFWLLLTSLSAGSARAEVPVFTIEIRQHLCSPSALVMPAHTKVKLVIINQDPTPEEFESYQLNRKKVIMGGATAIVLIGPLEPGI